MIVIDSVMLTAAYLLLTLVVFSNRRVTCQLLTSCANSSWYYSSQTGQCYTPIRRLLDWQSAVDQCSKLVRSVSTKVATGEEEKARNSVQLAMFNSPSDLKVIADILKHFNLSTPVWTAAYRRDNELAFRWQITNALTSFDSISWSGGAGSGNCIQFINDQNIYSPTPLPPIGINNAQCTGGAMVLCQQEALKCTNPPGNFDPATMRFVPTAPYVGTVVEVVCKHGFRSTGLKPVDDGTGAKDKSTDATVMPKLKPGQYACVSNTRNGVPVFDYSGQDLPRCKPIVCAKPRLPLNARLVQSQSDSSQQPLTDQSDPSYFAFNQVLTIQCLPDYAFPDRSFQRKLICTVDPENPSNGIYAAYPGTVLPLPASCSIVKCLASEAEIGVDFNMQPYYLVDTPGLGRNSNGPLKMNRLDLGNEYAINTTIEYHCLNGFTGIEQKAGVLSTCTSTGQWRPALVGCTSTTPSVPTGADGKFEGQVQEAETANQISTVLLSCVFVMVGLVVIFDLVNANRNIRQLRHNIRLNKLLWRKRQKLEDPDQPIDPFSSQGHDNSSKVVRSNQPIDQDWNW